MVVLSDTVDIDADGNILEFKIPLQFFHSKKHVLPTNIRIYYQLNVTHFQFISQCKISKYFMGVVVVPRIFENLSNIDEQNYVFINVYRGDKLVTKYTFIHNAKVTYSKWEKMNIEKETRKISINMHNTYLNA